LADSLSKRSSTWLALTFGVVEVALGMGSVAFALLNGQDIRTILTDAGWVLAISFSIVGALIAARRPGHPLGWIYLAIGFSQGLVSFAHNYSWYTLISAPGTLPGGVLMSVLGEIAWIPGLHLLLTYAILLFPSGRLPSPRWRPIAWLSALPLLAFPLLTVGIWPYRGRTLLENPGQVQSTGDFPGVVEAAFFPYMLLCGLVAIASLIIRYRNALFHERQQIRWLLYSAGILFGAVVAGNYWLSEFLEERQLTYLLSLPIAPLVPAAVGIAILRYRLLDIDILIRKTLVYAVLTGLLALVYSGGVIFLGELLSGISGEQSTIAIVVSTLAIAALFSPLRRRVQDFIDRRFYRRKYDAERIMAAFAATARDEVNVDKLAGTFIGAVNDTLQPERIILWIKEGNRARLTAEPLALRTPPKLEGYPP
jgi:hypothetical protein